MWVALRSTGFEGLSNSDTVLGALTAVSSPASLTTYTPDIIGRTTASSQTPSGGTAYPFTYSYNVDGSVKTMKYPSNRVVAYGYDPAGRAQTVGLNTVGATDYVTSAAYAPHGALSQLTLGNGLTETWTYTERLQGKTLTAAKAGTLLGLTYDYGTTANNGNVLTQTINAGGAATFTQSYQYDDVQRLTRVDETAAGGASGTWWAKFGYGQYGNRWVAASAPQNVATPTSLAQYDQMTNRLQLMSNNQALPAGAYDAAGYLTNHPMVGQMTNDGAGQMVRFVSGSTTVNLAYDGEGHRVQKTMGSSQTNYVYDAMGNLAAEYMPQPGPALCARCFLTADALGSTRLITDGTGAVSLRRDYMPFGEEGQRKIWEPAGGHGRACADDV